jgi:hypothetical protein
VVTRLFLTNVTAGHAISPDFPPQIRYNGCENSA